MGTIERALAKIRQSGGEAQVPPTPARLKEIAAEDTQTPLPGSSGTAASERKTIEFDFARFREAGLISSDNKGLSEQYRVIKQPLLRRASKYLNDDTERANLLMVTSALAGEGKTFTCVNLGLSLAKERDWEVILVDVDCKNPQLSRLLGVEDQPGFLDVLKGSERDLDAVMLSTNIERLSVVPLGQRDEHAAELIASSRMQSLCKELLSHPQRLVIFDSSPLLLTTEPLILAVHVGQIVVVVQSGQTRQQAVKAALAKLDDSKAIGVVLNRAEESDGPISYGGYGYGYGQAG